MTKASSERAVTNHSRWLRAVYVLQVAAVLGTVTMAVVDRVTETDFGIGYEFMIVAFGAGFVREWMAKRWSRT